MIIAIFAFVEDKLNCYASFQILFTYLIACHIISTRFMIKMSAFIPLKTV